MFHIIDDEKAICDILAELISLFGYDVEAFSCPVEYLDYMKSPDYQRPIAIFSDVRMPKMSGFEMIEEIRKYHPDQRFVVISGYSENEEAHRKQVCQYISKPFSPEEIEKTVRNLAKCHKHGPLPDIITGCKNQVDQNDLDTWECSLDCFDCGKKNKPS